MIANYHTHTNRCGHARGSDREYVEAAIRGGISVLGFADHCPFVFPNGYVSGMRMAPRDMDDYFRSLTDLKQEYSRYIEILIGFEAEYIPELMEAQDRLYAEYPVDYLILGQHMIYPEYDNIAGYTGAPQTSEEYFKRYIDLLIEGHKSGRYKYIAHPDLFNFIGSREVYDAEYRRLCRYMSEADTPVEINLLGLSDRRNYPNPRFLELAAEAGLKAVIGWDVHDPQVFLNNEPYKKCVELAERFGLPLIERLF